MIPRSIAKLLGRLNLVIVVALLLQGTLPPYSSISARSLSRDQGIYFPASSRTESANAALLLSDPNVSITHNGADISLTWTGIANSQGYEVHRSTAPFFTPGSSTLLQTLPANASSYIDAGAVGDPAVNHFYIIRAINGSQFADSNEVGEIDYALNNSGGKYSLIGLPFPSTTIVDTATLANAIGNVSTVLKWNLATQAFRLFTPPNSGDNFPVSTGDAVFVVVNSGGPSVFTMTGNVTTVQFALQSGGYNFLTLPLYKSSLTTASGVAADITGVQAMMSWNEATQAFRLFTPPASGDDFVVMPGSPFLAQLNGGPTLWPASLPTPTPTNTPTPTDTPTSTPTNTPTFTPTPTSVPVNQTPVVQITSPTADQVVASGNFLVTGNVTDDGSIVSVKVNGIAATLSGNSFSASAPLTGGNQVIEVVAQDNQGALGLASQVVTVDAEGPQVTIDAPKDGQAVYTRQPSVSISFSDADSGINPASLRAVLQGPNNQQSDITGNLTVSGGSAVGAVQTMLAEDASYTLTVSLADAFGSTTSVSSRFYIPPNPASITPPAVPSNAGWISGHIYNSTTCNQYLADCTGLPGVSVTLADSLGQPVAGMVVTGPDGFFAFPVAKTDTYSLRAEKTGFTYGQRIADIALERSTATNDLFLTPIDPVTTLCTSTGCNHANSDGSIQVVIPAGAIAAGQVVTTTATNFAHVEFLPSGELPPGTWETYAFNLGGDSEAAFSQPVTVRVRNDKGFSPGTQIPVGYWNQTTLEWEHEGVAVVDATGQWVEAQVTHYSNYDINFPILAPLDLTATAQTPKDTGCSENCECPEEVVGCSINVKSGTLEEWIDLPEVNVLGEMYAPQLRYSTRRVNAGRVIDIKLNLNSAYSEIGSTIGWELYIEGQRIDSRTFAANLSGAGEIGRFRYLWNGRNSQGQNLPPGVYKYAVKFTIPYRAQYCGAVNNRFGAAPDCVNRPTGRFIQASRTLWMDGTVTLEGDPDNTFGNGWVLHGQQQLNASEDGYVQITNGRRSDEYLDIFKSQGLLSVIAASQGGASAQTPAANQGAQAQDEQLVDLVAQGTETLTETVHLTGEVSLSGGNVFLPLVSLPAEKQHTHKHITLPANQPDTKRAYRAQRMATQTSVCGSLSTNTTWTLADSPYLVTCDVTVESGVTLSIEPGVAVKLGGANSDLQVFGALVASGSSAQPVTFTSFKDDSIGGDTNNDGNASIPTPGDWGQIYFHDSSAGNMLNHCTIAYGGSSQGGANSSVRSDTGNLSLTNCTIRKSQVYGVHLFINSSGSNIILQGNSLEDNGSAAVFTELSGSTAGGRITVDANIATGNGVNGVGIQGNIAGGLNLDWSGQSNFPLVLYGLGVLQGGSLTLSPNTVIKARQQESLYVSGALNANGTSSQPVIFTSIRDDSVGGDTNNDGSATTPAPGDWGQIILNSGGSGNILNHCAIAYGGNTQDLVKSVLRLSTDDVTLKNCTVRKSLGYGLYLFGHPGIISIALENNSFQDNRNGAVYFDLPNNTGGQIKVSGNTATGNAINGLYFTGNTSGRLTMNWTGQSNFPLVLDGFTVLQNGRLTLSPGTVLKALAGGYFLSVNGSLQANGTASQPIIFTSFKDDSFGGDTNNDGNATTAAPGDWIHINFSSSSSDNLLNHCVIAYGGSTPIANASLRIDTGDISITRCQVRNSRSHSIYFGADVAPRQIFANSIFNNAGVGLAKTGTAEIDARNNWWGHPSGPNHPTLNPGGQGDEVGNFIRFDPWLKQPPDNLILNLLESDYSSLAYDVDTGLYTRISRTIVRTNFTAAGRHQSTTAPDGRKTTYTYNADGSVASMSITAPGETAPRWVWSFSYVGGRLASITDPAGRITRFTIDSQGDLTQVTLPDNSTRRFYYDSRHLLTQQVNQAGDINDYSYDAYGRVRQEKLPLRAVYNPATGQVALDQEVRSFTPSDTSYLLINNVPPNDPSNPAAPVPRSSPIVDVYTFPKGTTSGNTNKWGSWLSETDAIGRTTTYNRDEANNITRKTYPNGDCEEYSYDEKGNMLTRSQMGATQCALAPASRDPAQVQTWTFTYESRFNHIKTATDPASALVTYVYDYEENAGSAGHVIRIEYPAVTDISGNTSRPTIRYTYNSLGLVETFTDERGIVTRFEYTPEGWLTRMIENVGGLNLTTLYQDFDAAGHPKTIITPRGATLRYTYDVMGRLLTERNNQGQVTKYEYDAKGRLLKQIEDFTADGVTGRNLVTTFAYNPEDQVERVRTAGDGQIWETVNTYDIEGNLTTSADSKGQTTVYAYNAVSELISITDPLNQSTQIAYTGKGEVETITRPDNEAIGFAYDPFGNLSGLTPPGRPAPGRPAHTFAYTRQNLMEDYLPPALSGGSTPSHYAYNAFRQITAENRPDSRSLSFGYDSRHRLDGLTQPRGTITYGYNPLTSQLTSLSAPDNVNLAMTYDGELPASDSWSGAVSGSVGYANDPDYRLTSVSVNSAGPVAYQYGADHQLTQAGDLVVNRLPKTRLLQGTTLGQISDSWSYNSFGQITGYQASYGGALLYSLAYGYDALDRITDLTETIGGVTTAYVYGYDSVGRLVNVKQNGATIAVYGYDANGNRLSPTTQNGTVNGSYDEQDRLLTYGGNSYAYSANGELQSKTSSSGITTYNYDVQGNLMAATLPDGRQIAYLVDGQNRRIGKKVNGALAQGFLYQDQLEPVVELDGSGNVVSRFVYGIRGHVPDYMIKGGVTYRILSDHLGSVRLVVNAQTGAIAQRLDYDAFGNVIQDTSPGFQPFGFAGGLYDRDTGLTRFGARDYDPEPGRWTAKDPILFDGGDTNLYAYVSGNPVNLVDLQGLDAIWERVPGGRKNLEARVDTTQQPFPNIHFREKGKNTQAIYSPVKDWVENGSHSGKKLAPLSNKNKSVATEYARQELARFLKDEGGHVSPQFARRLAGRLGHLGWLQLGFDGGQALVCEFDNYLADMFGREAADDAWLDLGDKINDLFK